MTEKATFARPYARAAFEYARQAGTTAEWSDMLGLLGVIVADEQMQQLLNNPKVSHQQLQDLVIDVCGSRLSEPGKNFIRILVQAERLQYAPEIAELYKTSLAAAEGKTAVEVTSAYALEPTQEQAIIAAMTKRLGKKIEISSHIDESLIGGVIIRAGDSVIDASLRGRLQELKNEFL